MPDTLACGGFRRCLRGPEPGSGVANVLEDSADSRGDTAQIGWKPAVSSKMHPFHFDVLYAQYDGHSALDHHILHPIDNDANEGLPSCFPTFIGTTPTLGPVSPGQTVYAKSAWMNSCESLFVWTENRNVIVILSTLPSAKDLPNRRSVGTIWTSEPGIEPDPEVCPFSGRVCLLNRPRRHEPGSVQVMDYI